MKISQFIPEVLLEIEKGLDNPKLKGKNSKLPLGFNGAVEFDIAVTASEEASGKIGAEFYQ